MILKKEFFFIRHGQTDYNLMHKDKDHPSEIPLNQTGRSQAVAIEPIVATLPVQALAVSPMKRAQETKEIISPRLFVPHHAIEDLRECGHKVWNDMFQRGMNVPPPPEGDVRQFMDQVLQGVNEALDLPGPTLIIAHGGVHWATCCLMGIEDYDWHLNNCGIAHFSIGRQGQWVGKKLYE